MRFDTKALHAAQEPDPLTGAVIPPVYQTSTFRQEAIGRHQGYEYARTGNPTRDRLERLLAALEEARFGLAFSSGSAATAAVLSLLRPKDHVIAAEDLYGGTYRLIKKVFGPLGIESSFVDFDRPRSLASAIRKNTRLIWIETPTNPLLKIIDIQKTAQTARKHKILLAVDNTFASPYLQRPISLGADIVIHSTTKYLSGHSDVIGGAVITDDPQTAEEIAFYQNAAGAVPGPWDCWLVMRGIKTLGVRMRGQQENAQYIAEHLQTHPAVSALYYPGLQASRYHALAKKQMDGFGAMISLEVKGGLQAVERFLGRLRLFMLAESLGGVESLVCYPSKMTHAVYSREQRMQKGIRDSLIRLSVGLEDKRDLLEDIKNTLS